MPRMDGTGPMGAGRMTGRGLGFCANPRAIGLGAGVGMGLGLGLACRRFFGRGYAEAAVDSKTQKQLLNEQKDVLTKQLELVEKELDKME